jgi:glycosyltransferase involved in cell wall biosynthesis
MPCVATDCGGIADIDKPSRNLSLLLAESQTPEALADAILKLIDNEELRRNLGINASKHFSLESYQKLVDSYEELLFNFN